MKAKKNALLVLALLLGLCWALPAIAEEAIPPDVTYTFTTKALSEYLGSNGDVFANDPVVQSDLFVAFPHGFYADLWISRGEGSWNEDFGDEIDLTLGWTNAKKGMAQTWDLSVAHFWLAPQAKSGVVQLQGVRNWILRQDDNGNPTDIIDVKVEHYLPTSAEGPASGTIARVGLTQFRGLTPRWSFEHRLGIFRDTGAFDYASGWLAEWSGKLLFEMKKVSDWESTAAGPMVKCSTPLSLSYSDGRETDCAGALIFIKKF